LHHLVAVPAESVNEITRRIIECGLRVHQGLGPGLLESGYDACLTFELMESGLHFDRQKAVPIIYRGYRVNCAYRIDFLVEDQVVVEVKSVARLEPIHRAQLLSYLKLAKRHVGLLFNFNVTWFTRDGVQRIVHDFRDPDVEARRDT
jgi:GxxExxY protein